MPMIAQVLHEEGVPEELAYLALIESGFVTHSSSSSGPPDFGNLSRVQHVDTV